MKLSRINTLLSDKLRIIQKQLSSYKQDKKPERLHRIRVEIKKIKALLLFAGKIHKQNFYHGELKPLFRAAGDIRTAQVNIKLLKSLKGTSSVLITQLKKKESVLRSAFVKNIHVYLEKCTELNNKLSLPSKSASKKLMRKFFKKEIDKSIKALKKEERKQLHRFRMKIKQLMYVYDALPRKLQSDIKINTKEIDKFQKKTGEWHDTYSALSFLSHQHISTKIISKLKDKEQKQFKALLKNSPAAARMLNTSA